MCFSPCPLGTEWSTGGRVRWLSFFSPSICVLGIYIAFIATFHLPPRARISNNKMIVSFCARGNNYYYCRFVWFIKLSNLCRKYKRSRFHAFIREISTIIDDDDRFRRTIFGFCPQTDHLSVRNIPFFRNISPVVRRREGTILDLSWERNASPRDGQHPLRGDGLLGRTVPRSVRDVPKTISSSRGNSSVFAWYQLEARASPDSHVLPACLPGLPACLCLPADSSFLLSYFRPSRRIFDSINRFQTIPRLYVSGHVWGPQE